MKAPPRLPRPYGYRNLMPHLVEDILMVASPYDCFIMEEDGRFSDRLLGQYVELDLAAPPHFHHVSTGRSALGRLDREPFHLVLATPHFGGMKPLTLAEKIAARHPDTSVVMLTYSQSEALAYSQIPRSRGISQTFLWTGDPRLLVALVKSVEDMKNVDHDTRQGLVRVIILVEDSPGFYSSYLPIIYSEILGQVHSLLAERLNERDRRHRMRARPKILLARNFEEGIELFNKYHKYLLGTICDMRFPRGGKLDSQAGLAFIRRLRARLPDLPVLLQSREAEHEEIAKELKVHFADKNSPELLSQLRRFMRRNFGFGPFVFQTPKGETVGQASDTLEMVEVLRRIPDESLRYHAERNHISNWLMARSEFDLALEVRPKKVSDFGSVGAVRDYLVDAFDSFLERRQRGEITEFSRQADPLARDFTRIGTGSMGGKARGIAFLGRLLAEHAIHEKYPEHRIIVPRAVVVCTDVFDRFCERQNLRERVLAATTDEEVVRLILAQPLDAEVMQDLEAMVAQVEYPLAVRSSSLHEDSEYQPLAGLYRTFMLPNRHPDRARRLEELTIAIRLVYASVFLQEARSYMQANSLRVEEEKMAVIIQRLVGRPHGDRFYPDFAGVAQSLNYYPMRHAKPEDGIATVALGLGQSVTDGRRALRFSPRYPEILPQMATPEAALRASQRDFYALDLTHAALDLDAAEDSNLVLLPLDEAEKDGTLEAVGATYSPDNNRIYDNVLTQGPRLVTFAPVLKHGRFPLPSMLRDLLEIGEAGMATPVEMEFAVALEGEGKPAQMAVLQLRPLVTEGRETEVNLEALEGQPALVAGTALGNGILGGLADVVYIHPDRFDLGKSREIAQLIGQINHRLSRARRPYVLIGPGRWGTADRWLGIPVTWPQVSAAKVIVELQLPGSPIDPSQGTHFFQNLTSLRIGYFGIDLDEPDHRIDLSWLEKLPAEEEALGLRHVRLPQPLAAHIDGRSGYGLLVVDQAPPEPEGTGVLTALA